MNYNMTAQFLHDSYFNFVDDISPYHFCNDDYFSMDKNIHDDLRKKMMTPLKSLMVWDTHLINLNHLEAMALLMEKEEWSYVFIIISIQLIH